MNRQPLPGEIGDRVARFSNEVLTNARPSNDGHGWYAVIDVGPKSYVSDPDFSSYAETEARARELAADKIRQDFWNVGKYAPHFDAYNARYRLIKHWEAKEAAHG